MRKTTLFITLLSIATPGCGSGKIGGTNNNTNNNTNTEPDAHVDDDGSANNNADAGVDADLPGYCGDGIVQTPEVCDDGNNTDGDECSADCSEYVFTASLAVDGAAYDIQRDETGQVHMIWKASGPGQPIKYGLITGCQSPGTGDDIPQSGQIRTRGFRPRMAVKPDGTFIHVSWSNPAMTELYHAWNDGNGWQQHQLLPASTGMIASQPVSGVDASGRVHIIAMHQENSTPFTGRILYWRMRPDGTFIEDADILFSEQGVDWRSTAMFTTLAGDIHAVWKAVSNWGKYTHVASDGSLMNQPLIDIPPAPASNHAGMGDLFVTETGDVHAVCTDYAGTDQGIWHAFKPAGAQAFDTPTTAAVNPFFDNNGDLDFDPWGAVAVDSSGRILVSWGENPNNTDVVSNVYVSVHDNGNWNPSLWDGDADIHPYSKTAMTTTSDSTYMVWRTATADGAELMCSIMRFAP